jgi:hypothetical protein
MLDVSLLVRRSGRRMFLFVDRFLRTRMEGEFLVPFASSFHCTKHEEVLEMHLLAACQRLVREHSFCGLWLARGDELAVVL